jgi:uncharacterized protein DUF6894
MPRYFFHLINGDYIADEEGEEFDLVEAAHARELLRNRPRPLMGYYISVVDEGGVVVFRVRYSPRRSRGAQTRPTAALWRMRQPSGPPPWLVRSWRRDRER